CFLSVALIASSANLLILKSIMVKGTEALHSNANMLPCQGNTRLRTTSLFTFSMNCFSLCVNLFSYMYHTFCVSRERIGANNDSISDRNNEFEGRSVESVVRSTLESPTKSQQGVRSDQSSVADGVSKSKHSARSLLKSESISASKCVVVKQRKDKQEESGSEATDKAVDGLSRKLAQLYP
ncbi:hypothetical protein B296_00037155, partial [Ensete ventricosum]